MAQVFCNHLYHCYRQINEKNSVDERKKVNVGYLLVLTSSDDCND